METKKSHTEKCKIEKTILGGHLVINPLLLNLDNRPLSNEEISNCECTWYDSCIDQSSRVIKFMKNDNATYQGTSTINNKMSKTILVLQNKITNKVQLVEVRDCQLERVLPKPSMQTNYDNDEIKATYEENKSNLLKAFGSKKSKRMSDIGSKMRINSDVTLKQMETLASGVEVDLKELEAIDRIVDSCMPPHHRDATIPDEVFLLEDLLTQEELNSMDDEAFVVFHLMPFKHQESGYSQFFIDTLERLQNKATEDRIRVLLYIETLMRFLTLNLQYMKRKDLIQNICPFSTIIAKKIIENFSIDTTNGRIRNVTMNDKIVIYVMILVLIVCDNSCNVEELSKYLPKFSVTKLGQMARALSLSTRDKITWFVKLPLPAMKSKFMRKSRK